jgi:16S rRNA (cytosine967-C5)-methyltransferase
LAEPDRGADRHAGARAVAARVLVRVWEEGAFASAALDAELARRQLDVRDAALATELVYGVLRTEPALEARLARVATRGKAHLGVPLARAHLAIGAYSLAFLDRVPAFAAVSEAVAGAREADGERTSSFVNALLRAFGRALEQHGRPRLEDAVAESAPGWLRGALRKTLGRAGASAYLAAGPVPPPIGLTVAPGRDRDEVVATLRAAAPGATIEPGLVSPHAVLVRGAGDVRRLPGVGDAWIVQEEGAAVIALALDARPDERVLDACAGHGNKSWLLAHQVGSGGAVDAADLHAHKLDELARGPAGRLVRARHAVDWCAGAGDVPEGYDAVIVDAPCSGTGTLRRRPEIAIHREAEDVARLAATQVAITRRAATRVRDGGRLVFAVCSVLREEAEAVVERLVAPPGEGEPDVRLEPAPLADRVAGGASTLRLLPHVQGTDGYFAAGFVVRR